MVNITTRTFVLDSLSLARLTALDQGLAHKAAHLTDAVHREMVWKIACSVSPPQAKTKAVRQRV